MTVQKIEGSAHEMNDWLWWGKWDTVQPAYKVYRDEIYSLQILLSRTQAGPGRTVKQEQGEISPHNVQRLNIICVHFVHEKLTFWAGLPYIWVSNSIRKFVFEREKEAKITFSKPLLFGWSISVLACCPAWFVTASVYTKLSYFETF